MNEVGYDLSRHVSKSLSEIPVVEYDVAVTMGCGDTCPNVARNSVRSGTSPIRKRCRRRVPEGTGPDRATSQRTFNAVGLVAGGAERAPGRSGRAYSRVCGAATAKGSEHVRACSAAGPAPAAQDKLTPFQAPC